jgi:uncharacterized protein involved in exopolysaccharide biosynthesis
MKTLKIIFILTFVFSTYVMAQTKSQSSTVTSVKATAAYAEVLLRQTELLAEIESLLLDYTEEFPRVKQLRAEIGFLQKEISRLQSVPPTEFGKLSAALGKLMLRKAEAETELWNLQKDYKDDHPEVRRAKRKVEIFENAIREILEAKQ